MAGARRAGIFSPPALCKLRPMEIVAYGGWERCARLVDGDLEVIVTLEVGPRIIRFGRIDGPNELVEYAKDMGSFGGSEYRSYGGHRLWVAPEDPVVTYEPDNEPVVVTEFAGGVAFTKSAGSLGIERTIAIRLEPGRVLLDHRITNYAETPRRLAPWCLTVMAPGGACLFPLPEFRTHSEALLPAAPLVLWHYTRMADPRWTWGNRVVRLRHDAGLGPQKVGAAVPAGFATYSQSRQSLPQAISVPRECRLSRLRMQLRDLHASGYARSRVPRSAGDVGGRRFGPSSRDVVSGARRPDPRG